MVYWICRFLIRMKEGGGVCERGRGGEGGGGGGGADQSGTANIKYLRRKLNIELDVTRCQIRKVDDSEANTSFGMYGQIMVPLLVPFSPMFMAGA